MSDDPLNSIPAFSRVSIRAVLVHEGEDPHLALAEAGIFDAVAIPVLLGNEANGSSAFLGDGITGNLTAVLEPDQPEDDLDPADAAVTAPQSADTGQPEPEPTKPRPLQGSSSLAPIPQRRR